MNGNEQQGFSLIELMTAVVIVGILAATALPAYVQDYTVRAKLSEGVVLGEALKTAISETYQNRGPSDMSCVGEATCANIGATFIAATRYVAAVTSDSTGIVRIKFHSSVLPDAANTLAIAPAFPSGTPFDLSDPDKVGAAYVWDCGAASATPGVDGAGVAGGTTIPDRLLPAGCKR
jgi:type IV pilus assembly protein PilA